MDESTHDEIELCRKCESEFGFVDGLYMREYGYAAYPKKRARMDI